MTEQEKQLLLIDLCARLPYGVKCDKDGEMYDLVSIEVPQGFVRLKKMVNYFPSITTRSILREDVVKPYLRPMSSMTEEEKQFLRNQKWCIAVSTSGIVETTTEGFDWLNKKHFDYRGLIPMEFALEAPEGMYTTHKKITCDNCENNQYCSQSEYVKKNCYKL